MNKVLCALFLLGLLGIGAGGVHAEAESFSQDPSSESYPDEQASEQSPPDMFGGPDRGESAPDFSLKTLDGQQVELRQYIGRRPVVLEFGSYTCPIFRNKHTAMEELHQKYGDRATFLTVYIVEAHPKGDPSPYSGREWITHANERTGILFRQPVTEEERKALAERAREDLGIQTPVLIDTMENSTWESYGAAPNAAYLIGADGRIKLRQGWFKPSEFEKALASEAR